MTEHDLVDAFQRQLKIQLPTALVWKINDRSSGGKPDLEVNCSGATTKIEFKHLIRNETLHDVWEDERQPITCLRYEQTTGRCWIVCYREAYKKAGRMIVDTLIYKPSAVFGGKLPEPRVEPVSSDVLARVLWADGVLRLPGYAHHAVITIIKQTHV